MHFTFNFSALSIAVIFILSAIIFLGWLIFRRAQSGPGSQALNFGKSKAHALMEVKTGVKFDDIAGIEEAKKELYEILDFLKNPQKYTRLGAKIPKGVLLKGPPGTGKTLLAKAIAGEAGVPFFSISGSEFVEMFVGVGAARVRDLFEQAKANAPCIIFIDEIDAIGHQRGSGLGGGNDEREQTLNQLLTEMGGFDANEGVIVLAATNRADILDQALLRPGRFDRTISIQYPKTDEREMILRVHSKGVSLDSETSLRKVAEITSGFSGAELSAVANEAKILAASQGKESINFSSLESSVNKVRRVRKEKVIVENNEDKWRIAIHECGHLAANFILPCLEKVESISIFNPYQPDWFYSSELRLPQVTCYETAKGTLVMLLSGRASEEFFFREVSSISENDIAIATALTYKMFSSWGMNKQLGLVNNRLINEVAAINSVRNLIGLDQEINTEIKNFLEETYILAQKNIESNASSIVEWASELFDKESLGYKEINNFRAKVKFKLDIQLTTALDGKKYGLSEETLLEDENKMKEIGANTNDHVIRRISALKRRKEIVELQLANLGLNAPSSLIMEKENIEDELSKIQDK